MMTQHPLADALRDIINPLAKLRRDAEAKDREIGPMAYSIANDINFIQGIARDALAQYEKSDTDRDGLREATDVLRGIEVARDRIAPLMKQGEDNIWRPAQFAYEVLGNAATALASKTAIDPVTVRSMMESGTNHWLSNGHNYAGLSPQGLFEAGWDAAIRALGKDQ